MSLFRGVRLAERPACAAPPECQEQDSLARLRLALGSDGDLATATAVALDQVQPGARRVDHGGVLHGSATCIATRGSAVVFSCVQLDAASSACTTCLPLRTGPFGQAVETLCRLEHLARPMFNWSDVARVRRMLAQGPLATLPTVYRPGWRTQLDNVLTERLEHIATIADNRAVVLNRDDVVTAILAHDEALPVRQDWAKEAKSSVLWNAPSRPTRLTRRVLAAALAERPVDVLVVAADRTHLALDGALEALVDLCAVATPAPALCGDQHMIISLPPRAAAVVERQCGRLHMAATLQTPQTAAATVVAEHDLPYVEWAVRLWSAQPTVGLAVHLQTAQRIARRNGR